MADDNTISTAFFGRIESLIGGCQQRFHALYSLGWGVNNRANAAGNDELGLSHRYLNV
jgi:hypothetical protein